MLVSSKVVPACARDRERSLTCQVHEQRQLLPSCVSAPFAQQCPLGESLFMLSHCSSSRTCMLKMQPSMMLLKQ